MNLAEAFEARGETRGIEIGETRGEARGIEIGESRGEARKQTRIATNMLERNMPIEDVASYSELSIEAVKALKQQLDKEKPTE